MFEYTIRLTRPPAGAPAEYQFAIADLNPLPVVQPPPGYRVQDVARRNGQLVYTISQGQDLPPLPAPDPKPAAMPSDQSLIRLYVEFRDQGWELPWLENAVADAESVAKFTDWMASRLADDVSAIPNLADYETDVLPDLRAAWHQANTAVTNASRMTPPTDPPTDTDFLFQVAEPASAGIAVCWPISKRAKQYVSRQNQHLPDRIIAGHHPALRHVLEYEGYTTTERTDP